MHGASGRVPHLTLEVSFVVALTMTATSRVKNPALTATRHPGFLLLKVELLNALAVADVVAVVPQPFRGGRMEKCSFGLERVNNLPLM